MKIKSVDVTSFGGLKNFRLDFSEGTNIIYGKNGSGKSTVMNFIKLVLYGKTGKERSSDISKNLRKKTMPLDGSLQQGNITINYNNCDYLIEKKFGKTPASDEITVTNLHTGEKISLDTGTEPGEYFTGLSLAQFERCCYIMASDYVNLETELTDLKEFSSSEDDVSGSYTGSVFAELNKRKEKYISKSKKKGIIIDKEIELNKILLEIEKSLENEKIIANLDNEFDEAKKIADRLKSTLEKSASNEKNLSKLKTLKKLFELKCSIENIEKKFEELGLKKKSVHEYLSLGEIFIQNTLTRLRIYNETKANSNAAEYEQVKEARNKATELLKHIKTEGSKLNLMNSFLERIAIINNKKALRKKFLSLLTITIILSLVISILALLTPETVFIVASALMIFADVFLCVKALKLKREILIFETELNADIPDEFNDIRKTDTVEVQNMLNEYNEALSDIYTKNGISSFEELTEKYYLNKAEYERSDSEALRITALESSKKFISHVNKIFTSETFEDAKENFDNFKSLVAKFDSISAEYAGLLDVTENNDKSSSEYESEINEINALLSDNNLESKKEIEQKIADNTERMLNIKGEYPKNFKSVYELKHIEDTIKKELAELNEEYCAIQMAENILKEAFNEISHGFIPEVNKIASSILSKLENINGSEIIITDNVVPKVKRDITGDFVDSGYMSESQKERIYFALRLSILSAIEKSDLKLPVIADDIFSSYDKAAMQRSVKFLEKFSDGRQVILFTCHEDVKNSFSKADILEI